MDLARHFNETQDAIKGVHRGDALATAVSDVEASLPDGPVMLLADSDEGLAVAAAVVARGSATTEWSRVDLQRPPDPHPGRAEVVVQVGEPPAAWFEAMKARYPGAVIVVVQVEQPA